MKFDETVIILISTHGVILARETKLRVPELKKFILPNDMLMLKINATVPGLCNIVDLAYINCVHHFLHKNIDFATEMFAFVRKNPEGFNEINIRKGFQALIDELKDNETEITYSNKPEHELYVDDPDIKNYRYSKKLKYLPSPFNGGDIVVNKKYSRSEEEYEENLTLANYDFKINYVNDSRVGDLLSPVPKQYFPPGETLFRNAEVGGKIYHFTHLSDLVNYLYKNGTKNLLLVDYSCSTIENDKTGSPVSPRSVRRIKRGYSQLESTATKHRKTRKTSPSPVKYATGEYGGGDFNLAIDISPQPHCFVKTPKKRQTKTHKKQGKTKQHMIVF